MQIIQNGAELYAAPFMRWWLAVAGMMAILSGPVQAGLMYRMEEKDLALGADTVIEATVADIHSFWNADQTRINSLVTLKAVKPIRGRAIREPVHLLVSGGTVGVTSIKDSITPEFHLGERAVLFLCKGIGERIQPSDVAKEVEGISPYHVYGYFQGKKAIDDGWADGFPLDDLKRRIREATPDHVAPGINPENLDLRSKTIMEPKYVANQKWGGAWPAVSYQIHTSFTTAQNQAIRNAAETWSAAGAKFAFTYAGTHEGGGAFGNSVNEIIWEDLGDGGVLARATWRMINNVIVECDTEFNTRMTWSTSTPPGSSANDMESVALHEFGHWLSLGHSSVSTAVMWPSLMRGTAKRSLHTDDRDGILAQYGAGSTTPLLPPPLVTPGNTSPPGTSVSTLRPNFQWQAVTGADGYALYISKYNGTGYSLLFDSEEDVGSPLTGTSYTLPSGILIDGGQYRWNMSTHNSAGYGSPNTSRLYFYVSMPSPTRVISLSGDLAFGNVTAGSSATRILTISNTGNSTLTVSSISYPSRFSGNWSGGTIAAGSTRNVTVTFSPTAAQSYGGTITVNSDKTSGTNARSCSGTGTASPTRIISLAGDLAFGNVTAGSSATRILTISNTGNSTLTVSSISYPSRFSGNWSGGTIAAGSTRNVTVTFSPTAAQSYSGTITVNSDKTSGTNARSCSGTGTASSSGAITLGDVLDAPFLAWTTGGNANWLSQVVVTYDGVDAARSGAIGDGQQSWIQTTVEGPGTIWYRWVVSSELGFDWLKFYYNGYLQDGSISGLDVAWQHKGWNVPAGIHTLRWSYEKDESLSSGADAGWLDQVVWEPGGSWDAGYQSLGSGWRRLAWFGDYIPMGTDGWFWHSKHGFWFPAQGSTPQHIWFYSQDMGWLYTGSTQYPFLYRANDRAWLWHNGSRNPRWFRNMTTGRWERWP